MVLRKTECFVNIGSGMNVITPLGQEPVEKCQKILLVIHRQKVPVPNQNGQFVKAVNEVQSMFGYPLREAPLPSASIDGKAFQMMPEGEAAWLASSSDEPSFVTAMKGGSTLVVKGQSQRGTDTTDTYDLGGVTAAMDAISQNCGWTTGA